MNEEQATQKSSNEGATYFIKEEAPLTLREKEILSSKTGYGISSIDKILRGSVPVLPRHRQLIDLYKQILHIKQLHEENYEKELEELLNS